MNNELTDKAFWSNYWESKTGLAFSLPEDYLFHKQLEEIIRKGNIRTAVELGGFPGYYAIFLKKYFNVNSSLLDYFVHPDILEEVLKANGLSGDDIEVIETDLFNYTPARQYELVLSCGLIEHFQDTREIIGKHLDFLKPGGTLFITLPNFTGVNGWVQKKFDPENYRKHNIASMNPLLLKTIAEELGLTEVKATYFGGFSVWLENKNRQSALTNAFIKALWWAGKIPTKLLGFESKTLSPYIVLVAKKPR